MPVAIFTHYNISSSHFTETTNAEVKPIITVTWSRSPENQTVVCDPIHGLFLFVLSCHHCTATSFAQLHDHQDGVHVARCVSSSRKSPPPPSSGLVHHKKPARHCLMTGRYPMRAVCVCECMCECFKCVRVCGGVMSVISRLRGNFTACMYTCVRVCLCVFSFCMHVCFFQSGNMTLQLAFSVIALAICLAAVQWQQ